MAKEFEYNDIIYDSDNCLEYMKETGDTVGILSKAEIALDHDQFVKLLINCLRLKLVDTDSFLLEDYVNEEQIFKTILVSIISRLNSSGEDNKEDVFRSQLAHLLKMKSKTEESEEQIEKLQDFLNDVYIRFRNGRRPDLTMIADGEVIGINGVINKALEKSGYSFSENKPKQL